MGGDKPGFFDIAQLRVPVLLVAEEYDRMIPAQMGRRAAALTNKVVFGDCRLGRILLPNRYFHWQMQRRSLVAD